MYVDFEIISDWRVNIPQRKLAWPRGLSVRTQITTRPAGPREDDPRLGPSRAFNTSIAFGAFGAPGDGIVRLPLSPDVGGSVVGPLGANFRSSLSGRSGSKSRSSSLGSDIPSGTLRNQELEVFFFRQRNPLWQRYVHGI